MHAGRPEGSIPCAQPGCVTRCFCVSGAHDTQHKRLRYAVHAALSSPLGCGLAAARTGMQSSEQCSCTRAVRSTAPVCTAPVCTASHGDTQGVPVPPAARGFMCSCRPLAARVFLFLLQGPLLAGPLRGGPLLSRQPPPPHRVGVDHQSKIECTNHSLKCMHHSPNARIIHSNARIIHQKHASFTRSTHHLPRWSRRCA